MSSLFEIAEQYSQAFMELAEIEGIDQQTIDDTLEAMEGTFEIKAQNVAAFFQNIEAEAKAIKDAEQRMYVRRKALEQRANRMREYLKENMLRTGITKISCPYFSISVQKSADKVVIDDESMIPKQFIKEKVTKEPDKTAIREAGGCPGATMETNYALRIR